MIWKVVHHTTSHDGVSEKGKIETKNLQAISHKYCNAIQNYCMSTSNGTSQLVWFYIPLTHWDLIEIAPIVRTAFWNARMLKGYVCVFRTSHLPGQRWWHSSMTLIRVLRLECVNKLKIVITSTCLGITRRCHVRWGFSSRLPRSWSPAVPCIAFKLYIHCLVCVAP